MLHPILVTILRHNKYSIFAVRRNVYPICLKILQTIFYSIMVSFTQISLYSPNKSYVVYWVLYWVFIESLLLPVHSFVPQCGEIVKRSARHLRNINNRFHMHRSLMSTTLQYVSLLLRWQDLPWFRQVGAPMLHNTDEAPANVVNSCSKLQHLASLILTSLMSYCVHDLTQL
jgi:hypothetical protein